MIEVENLTKYYGILAAIEDVSFTVQEGEILGFLGQQYEITSHTTIVFESEDRRQEIFQVDEQSLTGGDSQGVTGDPESGAVPDRAWRARPRWLRPVRIQSGHRCSRKGQLCCQVVSTWRSAVPYLLTRLC